MARMDDGFSTVVTFAATGLSGVKLYMKTVTPPSIMGGGGIDITTMHNTAWRTKVEKKLKELGNLEMTCAYDPAVYTTLVSYMQVNTLVTITFPDTSTVAFWGFIDEFTPGENSVEEDQPTADVVIVPTLTNGTVGSSFGAEVAPVYTAPST